MALPPPRAGIDWHTKGAACISCADKRWTDCDKLLNPRALCTNRKHYGGRKCNCAWQQSLSWAELLEKQARAEMKARKNLNATQLNAPKEREIQAWNPDEQYPATAVQAPVIPDAILNDVYAAFGWEKPAAAELSNKRRAPQLGRNAGQQHYGGPQYYGLQSAQQCVPPSPQYQHGPPPWYGYGPPATPQQQHGWQNYTPARYTPQLQDTQHQGGYGAPPNAQQPWFGAAGGLAQRPAPAPFQTPTRDGALPSTLSGLSQSAQAPTAPPTTQGFGQQHPVVHSPMIYFQGAKSLSDSPTPKKVKLGEGSNEGNGDSSAVHGLPTEHVSTATNAIPKKEDDDFVKALFR